MSSPKQSAPAGLAALTAAAAAKNNSMVAARLSNDAAISGTYATLDIGAPKDGRSWEAGCKQLGRTTRASIINDAPTMDQLVAFFRTPAEWFYMSGHFYALELFSDKPAGVTFSGGAVEVAVGSETRRLPKASGDFQLHLGCKLVIWAGCSTLKNDWEIRTFRTLFNNPVLLGYASMTGSGINDAMLGGGFITNAFFSRVRTKLAQNDRNAVRNAWMETANWGYGGGALESKFRAVDADGQEWMLSGKKVVAGRKL